jgi:predicted nuclease of predicted toxin-antitoxin system
MRFLVDASSDARLVPYLRSFGHDVTRVGTDYPADLPDREVLATAHREHRILITDDRDFGELIFRHRHPHDGVIYLRLTSTALAVRIARLAAVLSTYPDGITEFLIITEDRIRLRPTGGVPPER